MAKDKGLQIEVRLPKELADQVREVATLAGVAPEDAIKIAIALDMRRWNRESGVRAQRDELLVFAQEAAQAQVQDAKDADTTGQTAIVDSAGSIKYVHVEIFNAMKARAEEAEAMFFKATQDAKDAEVYAEIDRTTAKFPTWPTDPLHAVSVLGEEYGELVKATLQHTYEPYKSDLSDVREEAVQTAAMALRFVRSIDRYEFARCKQHSQTSTMAKESGNG